MSAYPQFGCVYTTPGPQVLVSPNEAPSPPSGGAGGPGSTTSGGGSMSPCYSSNSNGPPSSSNCCENGRPLVTDPVTGQPVCSCPYDSAARLAALTTCPYPRLTTTAGVYGTPYPSTDQNPYPSIDSTPFYPALGNPYALKDNSGGPEMTAWASAGLQTTPGYYHYDPTIAAYGYSSSYDLAARRKNATRESTATLKAWLNEHKKNPYPTKGEKIMLAIITKMTLTQVSTWFANARRRLKKENKMTWEPKNKTDDDEDTVLSDSDKDKDDLSVDGDNRVIKDTRIPKDGTLCIKSERSMNVPEDDEDLDEDDDDEEDHKPQMDMLGHTIHQHQHMMQQQQLHRHPHAMMQQSLTKSPGTIDCGIPLPPSKPKIWSLADTAACKTPPPHQQWCNSNFNRNGFVSGGGPYSNRYSSSSGYYSNCQNSGFPEVQTDTPPQTPPNLKLPNAATTNGPPSQASSSTPVNYNSATSSGTYMQQQQYVNTGSSGCYGQMPSPQKENKSINKLGGPAVGGNTVPYSRDTAHQHQPQNSSYFPNSSLVSRNNPDCGSNEDSVFKPLYKNVCQEQMNGPFAAAV